MGLSEREKRVLAEMERELFGASSIDPKLRPANSVRKLVAGVLLAVIGLSVLVFAAISAVIWFGLIGFAITLFGVLMASATPAAGSSKSTTKPRSNKPKPNPGTFFENRWDNRQGE
ncbi:MAG: DUF3040 domain-containing protein [Micrococcales bacterium]